MYIKKIKKYYDDEKEAEVIVSDGKYDLLCYALFCENSVGDTNFNLMPFGCNNIMTSGESEYKVWKLEDGYYAYKLQGKLVNFEKDIGSVQIGNIIISNVNGIPSDIQVGEYIEFSVIRIDI